MIYCFIERNNHACDISYDIYMITTAIKNIIFSHIQYDFSLKIFAVLAS